MEHKDDHDVLHQSQIDQVKMDHLTKLDQKREEQEGMQILIEQRRLEFARWLVTTGRLSEQIV